MMYRTSQKCLKLCCCVPHGALGGPGISESTCKEKVTAAIEKYDYGLDVLLKNFSALSGLFPFAGQV